MRKKEEEEGKKKERKKNTEKTMEYVQGQNKKGLCCYLSVAERLGNVLLCISGTHLAETIFRAAALRQKSQIKLTVSPRAK